jgi:hypothetical protein
MNTRTFAPFFAGVTAPLASATASALLGFYPRSSD